MTKHRKTNTSCKWTQDFINIYENKCMSKGLWRLRRRQPYDIDAFRCILLSFSVEFLNVPGSSTSDRRLCKLAQFLVGPSPWALAGPCPWAVVEPFPWAFVLPFLWDFPWARAGPYPWAILRPCPAERSEACSERSGEVRGYKLCIPQTKVCT